MQRMQLHQFHQHEGLQQKGTIYENKIKNQNYDLPEAKPPTFATGTAGASGHLAGCSRADARRCERAQRAEREKPQPNHPSHWAFGGVEELSQLRGMVLRNRIDLDRCPKQKKHIKFLKHIDCYLGLGQYNKPVTPNPNRYPYMSPTDEFLCQIYIRPYSVF